MRRSRPVRQSCKWTLLDFKIVHKFTREWLVLYVVMSYRDEKKLPSLYSMLHPLDEVAPVICRAGSKYSAMGLNE